MTSTGEPRATLKGWFITALLVALASALVPALCHSGFPASRLTGSAFDPTTSAVALRGREQRIVRPVVVHRDDTGSPAAAPTPLSAKPPREIPAPAVTHPAPTPVILASRRDAWRQRTSAQPRAPPPVRG